MKPIENGGTTLKKNAKPTGKRGRKANTNHKENLSTAAKSGVRNQTNDVRTANGCANNTRSKCRKSRSGRSIRNSTRLSSLNYNDNEANDSMDTAVKTRRGKLPRVNNDATTMNCINNGDSTGQQQLINGSREENVESKKVTLSAYTELKLDDQLHYAELTGQRQQSSTASSQQRKQLRIGKQLDDELSNSKSNCTNQNDLYKGSLSCTMNECINLQQQQQQHPPNPTVHTNGDYITSIENENSLHFMQQMHGGYSLTSQTNEISGAIKANVGQHFNLNNLNEINELNDKLVGGTGNAPYGSCKASFMQGLNESQITTADAAANGNNAILSTETNIDERRALKEDNEDDDLDEIQRASLILDDTTTTTKNNALYAINTVGLSNVATINNSIQRSSPNYSHQQATSCCSINTTTTNTSQTSSLHRDHNNNSRIEAQSSSTYTLCCTLPAQANHNVYAQCLDRSNLEHRTLATTSFTQSNPLLASTSTDSSTVTSLTSMSPVQVSCSKSGVLSGDNQSTANNTGMLQVLTNNSSTNNATAIELMDGGLNGQSSLIHYSNLRQAAQLAKQTAAMSTNNGTYSNGIREQAHLMQNQSQLMNQQHQLPHHHNSASNQLSNQQISLLSNHTDHLYTHNTLDPNAIVNCSPDCADLLEQYQLEPINNLLQSSKHKAPFAEFDEQLENENNLNNINATTNFSLDAEKDVVYLLSSNNQNVSFLF